MAINETLRVRMGELERRLKKLPMEIEAWGQFAKTRKLNIAAHGSQILAIKQLMAAYERRQKERFDKLRNDPITFGERSNELVKDIIESHRVWDFFREKLELRFSDDFKDALWVADTIAWDCHRPVLETAAALGLVDKNRFREPPLTYLSADFAPTTWVRGDKPRSGQTYHLGNDTLPIPVIAVPADQLPNVWELLTVAHETAHDLEADLGIREQLEAALVQKLAGNTRLPTWKNWKGEVFADLLALELVGPSYTDALMHILLLPSAELGDKPGSKHPAPCVRIPLNVAYIRTMLPDTSAIKAHADRIEKTWQAFCDDGPGDFAEDFGGIFEALMDTKLPALQDNTVRMLEKYSEAQDQSIREAAEWLRGEPMTQPQAMRQRHVVAAARIAVDAVANEKNLADSLEKINERTSTLVRALEPKSGGHRGANDQNEHKQFIESFIDRIEI